MLRQGMCIGWLKSFVGGREPCMHGMTRSRFVDGWKRAPHTSSRQITSVVTTAFWGIYRWHADADLGDHIDAVFSCSLTLHICFQIKKQRPFDVSKSCMMFQRKVKIVLAPQCKPRRFQQHQPEDAATTALNQFWDVSWCCGAQLRSGAHLQHPQNSQPARKHVDIHPDPWSTGTMTQDKRPWCSFAGAQQ